MKVLSHLSTVLALLVVLFFVRQGEAFAQATAAPEPGAVITPDEVVGAARAYAPALKPAAVAVDTAHAQLARIMATNGLVLQNHVTHVRLDLRSAQNATEADRKTLSHEVRWSPDRRYSVADSPLPEPPTIRTEEAL